jgi:hypothetical protein
MSTTTKFATMDEALEAYKAGGKDRGLVIEQAKAEHDAVKKAKASKKRAPATPALEAVNKANELGLNRTKSSKGTGSGGRAVRFSDTELVEMVKSAVQAGEARTAGGCVKHFRAIGKGSNEKRVKRAWDAAIAAGMTVPEKPSQSTEDTPSES